MTWVSQGHRYTYIASLGAIHICDFPGNLHSIRINNPGGAGNVITVYDNPEPTGNIIAVIDGTNATPVDLIYNVGFTGGLTITSIGGTATDFTVSYEISVAPQLTQVVAGIVSPAFVQSKSFSTDFTTSTTIPVTFSANVTAGNTIAVMVGSTLGSATTITVADSLTNTYTQVDTVLSGSGRLATFYAKNITGGPCTITATYDTACAYRSIIVHEITGVSTTAPLDGHAFLAQTTTTATDAVTSGPMTTTAAGDYIFGATYMQTIVSTLYLAGTGFILRESVTALNGTPIASEDRIQLSAGAIAATFTSPTFGGGTSICMAMAFKR